MSYSRVFREWQCAGLAAVALTLAACQPAAPTQSAATAAPPVAAGASPTAAPKPAVAPASPSAAASPATAASPIAAAASPATAASPVTAAASPATAAAASPVAAPSPSVAAAAAPGPKPALDPSALLTPGQLQMAADFGAPPNQFTDETGKMDGLDVDLCGGVATQLGLQLQWTNLSFPGLVPGLQAKRFDALCTAIFINPDRKKIMNMVPYVQWGEGLLVQAGNPKNITCSPTSGNDSSYDACFAQLSGNAISVAVGGTTEQHLKAYSDKATAAGKPEITIRGFDSNAEAFQALANGQVIGTYVNDPQAYFFANQNPGKYAVAFEGYQPNQLALATLKDNTSLARNLQWALQRMQADGSYQQILKKWGVASVPSFDIPPD